MDMGLFSNGKVAVQSIEILYGPETPRTDLQYMIPPFLMRLSLGILNNFLTRFTNV